MEVMIDLETLSTRSHATILVLAAIKFNRYANPVPLEEMDTFYVRIDRNSCTEVGMHSSQKTMDWWNTQERKIRDEAFGGRVPIKKALKEFSKWFKGSKLIWSNGACFDIPILDEAYKRCNMEAPWKFYNARDTRTIWDLADVNPWDLPKASLHHALHDCHRQIWGVKTAMDRLGLKRK
jgi:hypothetical protein